MKVHVKLVESYTFTKDQGKIFDDFGLEVNKTITMNYQGFVSFLLSSPDPICVYEKSGVLCLVHPYEE